MAANSIIPPYPTFFEADGSPLENGYIYVGQPGYEAQSSPKASFFDLAMTIPTGTASGAAVRTLAGFPVQNGAAVMIYVDGDFSVTVKDRNGVLIYSALNRTFAFSLADTTGQPIQAPDGNFANAGFGFINEQNTGIVRQGAGVVQAVVLGNVIYQWSATGVQFLLPPSGAGFVTGVAAALDQDLKDIAAIVAVEGDMIYRNGTAWTKLAVGPSGKVLRRNDLLTPNIGPIWDDAIIARPEQATTAGAVFSFTAIPAWVKRVTVMCNAISLTGSDLPIVQLGTGAGFLIEGYLGSIGSIASGGTASRFASSQGFPVGISSAGEAATTTLVLTKFGTTNTWLATVSGARSTGETYAGGGGSVVLPGVLTQVRLACDGANTFDAGSVSISYE